MPLITSTLHNKLSLIFDKEYPGFQEFPQSLQDAASKWSEAIDAYAGSNIIPASTTVVEARQAFEAQLLLITGPTAAVVLPIAFTNYAAALSLGMQPSFTGTPPPIPLDFTAIFATGLAGAPSSAIVTALVSLIDAWFRTGLAVNNTSSATTNWN